MRTANPASKARRPNETVLNELIEQITVDADGEDEQLWAFRQAFEDDVVVPDCQPSLHSHGMKPQPGVRGGAVKFPKTPPCASNQDAKELLLGPGYGKYAVGLAE